MLLWLQGLIFTVLVPGVVAFYVPRALRDGHTAAGGWWSLGWILFATGALIYTTCLVNFLTAGGTQPSSSLTLSARSWAKNQKRW
jgi:hypothetical protein